jgi:glyoxylase I family protein
MSGPAKPEAVAATGLTGSAAASAGAVAIAALAVGAGAIGALAIGRLAIGRARIKHLRIDDLEVGSLRVDDEGASAAALPPRLAAATSKVSHVDLVVSSLGVSLPFYRELLGPLGWSDGGTIEGERGETVHYISVAGAGVAAIGLRESQSDAHPEPYDRYALGIQHLCLDVPSREVVDERARWARGRPDCEVLSGPAEHDYTPGYYAVFLADPDGIKIELLHRPGYWDTVGGG